MYVEKNRIFSTVGGRPQTHETERRRQRVSNGKGTEYYAFRRRYLVAGRSRGKGGRAKAVKIDRERARSGVYSRTLLLAKRV